MKPIQRAVDAGFAPVSLCRRTESIGTFDSAGNRYGPAGHASGVSELSPSPDENNRRDRDRP
jgi:hypothetical protein